MRRSKSTRRRVASANANAVQALPFDLSLPRSMEQFDLFPLTEVEDRRTWNPEGQFAPARSLSSPRHRLTVKNRPSKYQHSLKKSFPNYSQTKGLVSFKAPENVMVCVRRKIRKEVIFAKRKAGKVGQKRPRRSFYSSIHC